MAVYAPFTQDYQWPQDDLDVARVGPMPPVDLINRAVVGREYATYSALFSFPLAAAFGTTIVQIIATDQAADFWVDQVASITWQFDTQNNRFFENNLDGAVRVRDLRTGIDLGYTGAQQPSNWDGSAIGLTWLPNAIPLHLFRKFPNAGIEGQLLWQGTNPIPSGWRDTGTLIQPFCITRQGGLEVTVQSLALGTTGPVNYSRQVTLTFSGWKEYANASR